MKRLATGLMVLGTLVSTAVNSSARAAEVRLAWEGQAADARLVELANGEQGVIEVYVDDLAADDSLSGMFFSNEFAAGLAQVGAATVLAGWDSSSIPGTALGEGGQQVIYSSPTADANIFGPGSILVGTFTVEVQSGNPGDEFEIAFDLDFISVVDATAIFYQITATGSAVQDSAGRFHLGAGSPGYARMGITDERDPLIVRVKESSSGGGGGGGGTGGGGGSSGGGDDPGGDDPGGDDPGGDDPGGDDPGTDDPGTDDPGTDDPGTDDPGTDDPGTDDPGMDDPGSDDPGTDDPGTDDPGTDDPGSDNPGSDNPAPDDNDAPVGGICGAGMVTSLPLLLLGIFGLRFGHRRSGH
jgi:uncharacterized membrane protein YgcG